jgi:predicted Zn-dependent protease
LSWLLLKSDRPGALELARRATIVSPSNGAMMDTLAMALAAEKRYDEALATQRQAMALDPASATLRLHLAQIMVRAGKKSEAREVLTELQKLGDKFKEQDEVGKLLSGL